ncbi:MAG: hypothetical protein WAO07_06255 [Desulfobacterales bacterium]
MKNFVVCLLTALVLACGVFAGPAIAQDAKVSTVGAEKPSAASESGFDMLRGRWVRPDGGYVITILGVDPDGKLDAAYANPRPLPFAEARASRDDKAIRLFFELRAGGYNGSTYTLTYDPANDVLHGIYYQAVARQRFNVHFERAR